VEEKAGGEELFFGRGFMGRRLFSLWRVDGEKSIG
jgi:hypothetical protein